MASDSTSPAQLVYKRIGELTIDSVAVFRHHAEVKRTIELEVAAGTTTVKVLNVPEHFVPESLEITSSTVEVLDVQWEQGFEDEVRATPSSLSALEGKLADNRAKLCRLQAAAAAEDSAAKAAEEFLIARARVQPEIGQQDTLENLKAALVDVSGLMKEIADRKADLLKELPNLRRTVADLEKNVEEERAKFKRQYCITFYVQADAPGQASFDVNYLVSDAGWSPQYKLTSLKGSDSFGLVYLVAVHQNTGEAWANVPLTLNTTDPMRNLYQDELPPVDAVLRPKHEPESGYHPRMLMAKCAAMADDSSTRSVDGAIRLARSSAKPRVVPGNGSSTLIRVADFELQQVNSYGLTPTRSNTVHYATLFKNDSDFTLMPGPVFVHVGAHRRHQSQIARMVNPGEVLSLTLAEDPSVRVVTKPLAKFQEHSQADAPKNVTVYERRILVHNTNTESETGDRRITIFYPIPRSTDEKIKVDLLEPQISVGTKTETQTIDSLAAPVPGILINKDNILEWTVDIPSLAKSEYLIKYSVENPADENVDFKERYD